jgi:hypothetical protein
VPTVSTILGQGPQAPAGSNAVSIQPPTTADEAYSSDDDSVEGDEEDRPFTRDELKSKTMRGLSKRENKEKKKEGKRKQKAGR